MKLLFGAVPTLLEQIEFLLVFASIGIAIVWPRFRSATFKKIEDYFRRLADRPFLATAVIFFLPIVLRLLLLPLYPPPEPWTHDEFSFLLHADTFAKGRTTNLPHPLWVHFESIYLLSQPTYTAKYQPGQGAVLALGKLVGSEWGAVVVSMGVFCALIFWMLRAWLPASWALFGALITVIRIGVLSYWMNSYWGGTLAAIGGTLVLGVLPKLRQDPRLRHGLLIGLGLLIVMNTRPLEALLLAIVVAVAVGWFAFRSQTVSLPMLASRVVFPVVLFLAGGLAWQGYYNWRITGSAITMPYTLHLKTYGTPQGFFWQEPFDIKEFRHAEIRDEYLRQRMLHSHRWPPFVLARTTFGKIRTFWSFFLGPALTIPLLFLPWAWRDKMMLFALAAITPFAVTHITYHAFFPHYAAPIFGLILFVVVQCWRHLRVWKWRGQPVGLTISRVLPAVLCVTLVIPLVCRAFESKLPAPLAKQAYRIVFREFSAATDRAEIIRRLKRDGGKHLVFVDYQPGHNPDLEWVYNDADIDGADIVWAREWTPESNQKLIDYFRGRKVWVVKADSNPPSLSRINDARDLLFSSQSSNTDQK